jgi:outer membrane protein assembly factor BamB
LTIFCLSWSVQGNSKDWRQGVDTWTLFRSSWNKPEWARPVLQDNKVYVASSRGEIAVFDKETGTDLGLIELRAGALSTPGIEDGLIYLGMDDGFFRCLEIETGAPVWSYAVNCVSISEPALSENLVIFQTGRDIVEALSKRTGEWVWSYHHERRQDLAIFGLSPPLAMDGAVYVGLSDGYIAALSIDDGKEIWKTRAFTSGKYRDIDSRVSIDEYAVYATSYAGETAALSRRTGMVYWIYPEGGLARPCVDEKKVYIGTMDEKVLALDKMVGLKVWEKEFLTPQRPLININLTGIKKPAHQTRMGKRVKDENWFIGVEIVEDDLVVQDRLGKFFLLDPEGGQLRREIREARNTTSPMTIEQDNAYFLSNKGYLYKVQLK